MIEPVYLNDWSESKRQGLLDDFGIKEEDLKDIEILLASYEYADYSGDAYVLFKRGNNLYEIHGSHCSCYGLENQWKDPELTTLSSIEHRLKEGNLGNAKYSNSFAYELTNLINMNRLFLE